MPSNRGYTLRCKSCGTSWQLSQEGLAKNDVSAETLIQWHNTVCTGETFNEKCAREALEAMRE